MISGASLLGPAKALLAPIDPDSVGLQVMFKFETSNQVKLAYLILNMHIPVSAADTNAGHSWAEQFTARLGTKRDFEVWKYHLIQFQNEPT